LAVIKLYSRLAVGAQGKATGDTMTDGKDNDTDNIIDFKKAKKKDSSGGGDDGSREKYMYYAVQPVVLVEESERLIRLKYMTESGYLDLLGLLNQIQTHNSKKIRTAMITASVGVGAAVLAIILAAVL
jgi:hypothetical protein